MKRKRPGATWVSRELVWSPPYIGICTTERNFHAELKRLGAPPCEWITENAAATVHFLSHPTKGTCAIVCIRPRGKTSRAAFAALIVHEATHIWQRVRQELAERRPSSEFEAYSIQSICQHLFEAVGL